MKLLYCPECGDVFNLTTTEKRCSCGATGGHYLPDREHAKYDGDGIPIGISNNSFENALSRQMWLNREKEIPFEGSIFDAFFIPANCETFRKKKKDNTRNSHCR